MNSLTAVIGDQSNWPGAIREADADSMRNAFAAESTEDEEIDETEDDEEDDEEDDAEESEEDELKPHEVLPKWNYTISSNL